MMCFGYFRSEAQEGWYMVLIQWGRSNAPAKMRLLFCFLALIGLLVVFAGVSQSGGRGGTASAKLSSGMQRTQAINTGIAPETGEMTPELEAALNAFGAGRYDECRKLAQNLITSDNDSSTRAECVGLILLSHLQQGDFTAAREAVERLRPVSPGVCEDLTPEIGVYEAWRTRQVNRLRGALATAQTPREKAHADLMMGIFHAAEGHNTLALVDYSKAIEHAPESAVAVTAILRADLLLMQEDQRTELAYLKKIIHRYPSKAVAAQAQYLIASSYRNRGDVTKAISAYSIVVQKYSKMELAAQAQFAIASLYQDRKEVPKAEKAYLAVIRNYPATPINAKARESLTSSYYTRAAAADKAGEITTAIEVYRQAVHLDANQDRKSKSSLHLAHLYSKMEQWEQASAAAKEVLKLDPPDKREYILRRRRARDLLANSCYRRGHLQEALSIYQELLIESTAQPQESLSGSTAEPVERPKYEKLIEQITLEMNASSLSNEAPMLSEDSQEEAE
jgi:tetratricopeptide (TPR) repeat protein